MKHLGFAAFRPLVGMWTIQQVFVTKGTYQQILMWCRLSNMRSSGRAVNKVHLVLRCRAVSCA
jgi:hypothetical protein